MCVVGVYDKIARMEKSLIKLDPGQIYNFLAGLDRNANLLPRTKEAKALQELATFSDLLPTDEARGSLLEVIGYTAQGMFAGDEKVVWLGLLKLKQLESMWSGDSTDYNRLITLVSRVMPHKDWSLEPTVGGK